MANSSFLGLSQICMHGCVVEEYRGYIKMGKYAPHFNLFKIRAFNLLLLYRERDTFFEARKPPKKNLEKD